MKKYRYLYALLAVVLLLLLLTACQPAQESNTDPAGSTPSSSNVTPPSSSAVPPTSSVPTTNYTPATNPSYTGGDSAEMDGFAFIFRGRQPTIQFEVDISKLIEGHLYYIDLNTREITLICDETVVVSVEDDFNADFEYYVKASEPTKIYRTNPKHPKAHTVIYESTFGPINYIVSDAYAITKQEVLQFVADNKYYVLLDLESGETSLMMEQYYIEYALIAHGSYDTWNELDLVLFRGKLNEDDKVRTYEYSRSTGAIQDMDDGCC